MESNYRDEPLAAKETAGFTSPVSILVTSYRFRPCDIDGVSAKAIIDGIVHRGILQDDSAEYVTEIRYKQVKVPHRSQEKTVVRIEEV